MKSNLAISFKKAVVIGAFLGGSLVSLDSTSATYRRTLDTQGVARWDTRPYVQSFNYLRAGTPVLRWVLNTGVSQWEGAGLQLQTDKTNIRSYRTKNLKGNRGSVDDQVKILKEKGVAPNRIVSYRNPHGDTQLGIDSVLGGITPAQDVK